LYIWWDSSYALLVQFYPQEGSVTRSAKLLAFLSATALGLVALPFASLLAKDGEKVEVPVVEYRLPNGMLFFLVQRPSAPVFSAYLRFRVGGVDEKVGNTGISHLFEHMAFKGTRSIGTRDFDKERPFLDQIGALGTEMSLEMRKGKGASNGKIIRLKGELDDLQKKARAVTVKDEYFRLFSQAGAVGLNASTTQDMTSYFVSLPKNRLEFWARMEAARLADVVLREFYSERDVVLEERRLRLEASPDGALSTKIAELAFTRSPYRLPVIGFKEDISTITREEAQAFYDTYYTPGNAFAAIVGDIDIEETKKLLDSTFGLLPSKKDPPKTDGSEPTQKEERRDSVYFETSPQLLMAFHKPTAPEFDDYVFDVIDRLLSGGRTSRLYKALVKDKQIAQAVYTFGYPGARYENLFVIGAVSLDQTTNDQLEKAIYEELDKLATEGPTKEELDRVLTGLEADFIRNISSNEGLASQLTFFHGIVSDWRYVQNHSSVVRTITAEDVKRVAKTYFTKENRSVATLVESR
jgi:predicted Zn-dependent peptidase